jgi:hypothetical protein
MKSNTTNSKLWLWTTVPLAILLIIATVAGVFFTETYAKDAPYFATQGIAQDIITLFVTVPVMVIAFIFALRGSYRARLVWLGMLGYVLYSYILYAFAVYFNSLFLVYAAILCLAIYSFIGTISTTDAAFVMDAVTAERKNPPRFRKRTAIMLFVITAMFYFLWLSEIIPALIGGFTPQSITDNGLPSNPVHVLDLAILLPGLIMTGIMILKGKPLGYIIAPIFFGYGAMLGLAILAMVWLMNQQGFPIVVPQVVIFLLMTVGNIWLLVDYIKPVKSK